ncbi:MAG: hypothetical protein FWE62_02260 [Firmicutes bacterium]|nr:hypothetical protein [Bacillota bacterium]
MILIDLTETVAAGENVFVKYSRGDELIYAEQNGRRVGVVDFDKHSFAKEDYDRLLRGIHFTVARAGRGGAIALETESARFEDGKNSPWGLYASMSRGNNAGACTERTQTRVPVVQDGFDNSRDRQTKARPFFTQPFSVGYNKDKTVAAVASGAGSVLEWVSRAPAPARKMTFDESLAYLYAAMDEVRCRASLFDQT